MTRIAALALVALALTAGLAPAQVIYVQSPRRVVSYYAPPVVYSTPVVTYASPIVYSSPVVYSAPMTTYSSPVISYYPSTTVYSSPAVSYSYYPATTVYSAPAAVAGPGVVTTRSYYGFGIFRPRGVYTQTYVSPW